jgi:alpha-1,3-rhamnosyl/mannosyltransferase
MDAGSSGMKVILSVEALSPPLSGIGRYTWELARRIGQLPNIGQVRYHRARRWVKDPAALLVVDPSAPQPRKLRLKFPRCAENGYWKLACRGQVFHGPNYFLPPYADHGVVTVHDLSVFKYPETHPPERLKEYDRLFRQTLDKAEHIIAVSEATKREVVEYLGWPATKITAIYNGVSEAFAPLSAEKLAPTLLRLNLRPGAYVLCVSTVEPRKRIDALLQAYQRLPDGLRAAYPLVLAGGKGWLSEDLHALIDTGQRAGWLHYLGFVSDADLARLYAGARLFAYPSIYEGFGLPIAEAMASGVPVLTSDRSCLPEVAAGAAKLANPDDLDALAAGLEEGLTDSAWRATAINAGLQVASGYNWDKCAKQTAAVYEKVLN